jgi:conjugal transfer pilus assembly protein TraL
MSTNTEDYIPRHINSGMLLFLWEADTASIALLSFLIFTMLGSMILGFVVSFLLVKGWVKLKEEGGVGLITRLFYWFLYSRLIVRGDVGNSEVREYIG